MNAAADTLSDAPRPADAHHARPTRPFAWLLRREYWENRGGFLWAPFVAGGISLLLSAMGIVLAMVAAGRNMPAEAHVTLDDGTQIQINGMDLGMLTSKLGHEELARLGEGLDVTLLLASGWPFIVLAVVLFFYCLGCLYDERKDSTVCVSDSGSDFQNITLRSLRSSYRQPRQ
jgi:ABC-2 type transport system permease protein